MKILIIDDHTFVREALVTLMTRHIQDVDVLEAATLEDALSTVSKHDFNLVILDLNLPDGSGAAAVKRVIDQIGETPLVTISGAASVEEVNAAIQMGAKGFLPKTMSGDLLASALNVIVAGGTYLPAEYIAAMSQNAVPQTTAETKTSTSDIPNNFTSREFEILQAFVDGLSNKEIARQLDIQEVTVKFHSRQIFRKLEVKNRTQAAISAVEQGYCHPTT